MGIMRRFLFDMRPQIVRDLEAQRHVVALHQRAGIDRRELQQYQPTFRQQAFAAVDRIIDEHENDQPGDQHKALTHCAPRSGWLAMCASLQGGPQSTRLQRRAAARISAAAKFPANNSSTTSTPATTGCRGPPKHGCYWQSRATTRSP